MDATSDRATTPDSTTYSSRPGALVWSFRKSREQWRTQAKDAQQQLVALQAENAELRTRAEAFEKKGTTRDTAR